MGDVTVLPRDGVWTLEDLAVLPDDGLRYELVDGTLLVSAAPSKLHQRAVGNLYVLLRAACPPELEVFLAPTDYQPTQTRSLQPDLLVVSRLDPGDGPVTMPLALAVEVISPSSRSIDSVLKRVLYEQAGVGQYWLVDPEEPMVAVWGLVDGRYSEVGTARSGRPLRVDGPLAVTVDIEALLQ